MVPFIFAQGPFTISIFAGRVELKSRVESSESFSDFDAFFFG